MVGTSHIFLSDLELDHHRSLCHSAEKRAERLARLEVHRTVLDLYQHIVAKLSVKRHELVVCLVSPVRTVRSVYECSPHYNSVIWLQGVGKHVCSVRVGAAEVLRTGESLRIGFYEEASEIRDQTVNFFSLRSPPLLNRRIQRIRSRQTAKGGRRREVDRQVYSDSVWTHHVSNLSHSLEVVPAKHFRSGVNVVEHASIDTYGCIQPCIFLYQFNRNRFTPMPDGPSCITSFDGVVQVVPMVQDTSFEGRFLLDVKHAVCLTCTLQPLECVCAI